MRTGKYFPESCVEENGHSAKAVIPAKAEIQGLACFGAATREERLQASVTASCCKENFMSKAARVTLIVVILLTVFVIAVVVVAPRIFQVDRYRPQLISLLEKQTGRPVEIGHLNLSVFPVVSIQADRFTIGNPPGFPQESWLSIRRISARLDSKALWQRQVIIRDLDLDTPALSLRSNPQGKWNTQFSPVEKVNGFPPQDPPRQQPQPLFSLREISEITIEHGTLTMTTEAPDGRTAPSSLQIAGISGHLDHIALQGLLAPGGPFGFLSTGAAGKLSADELSSGKFRITQLKSTVRTTPAQLLLDPVDFKLYGGHATAKITIQMAAPDASYQTQATFTGVDAGKLLNQFPGLQGALTGTLQGQLTLSGTSSASADPLAGKQGEGVLEIRNGRWPKLKLNPDLLQLARVAQLGPASGDLSSFSSVKATWRLANEVLTTPSIQIAGSGLTGGGSGTVDLRRGGLLNYQGVGHIPAHANALTSVLAGISGSTLRGNELTISFALRGTLARPVFQLKPNYQMIQPQPGSGQNLNQAPQALQNLFKMLQPHKR